MGSMSRSRRKPWVKIPPDKGAKKRASRAVRKYANVPDGSAYKKVFDSWKICDCKWYTPKDKKATRK